MVCWAAHRVYDGMLTEITLLLSHVLQLAERSHDVIIRALMSMWCSGLERLKPSTRE